MALIDLDKFVASFITEIKKNHMVITYNIPSCIKKALEDQGLEYKGGEIVKISTKSEDERIRKALIDGFSNYYSAFSTFGKIKVENILAWLEKQGKPKFKIGDIISNNKVIYRVDGITKNCLGQDSYFLVNIEDEEKGLRKLIVTDSEGKRHYFGETEWLCEQVDRQFWIKKD